jgi:hypothetical protein
VILDGPAMGDFVYRFLCLTVFPLDRNRCLPSVAPLRIELRTLRGMKHNAVGDDGDFVYQHTRQRREQSGTRYFLRRPCRFLV